MNKIRPFRMVVTGHRPQQLGNDSERHLWVRRQLRRVLERGLERYRSGFLAISGMALGVDLWWAEEALALGVPVHAYVPFSGQSERWTREQQELYRSVLREVAHTVMVCKGDYADWKYLRRNEAMCNDGDGLTAVWNGGPRGGTAHCVRYWSKHHRKFILIDPRQMTLDWKFVE